MITNVLDYAVLDVYYQICLGMKRAESGKMWVTERSLRRPEFGDCFAKEIISLTGEGLEGLILPDLITARNIRCCLGLDGHFGSESVSGAQTAETLSCGSIRLRWSDERDRTHRDNGPAVVTLQGVSKCHRDGALKTLHCRSARFEWMREALYFRPSGPFMVDVRELKIVAETGGIASASIEHLSFRWALNGIEIPPDEIHTVTRMHDFGINMYSSGPSVFQSPVDEFNLYNELLTLRERRIT